MQSSYQRSSSQNVSGPSNDPTVSIVSTNTHNRDTATSTAAALAGVDGSIANNYDGCVSPPAAESKSQRESDGEWLTPLPYAGSTKEQRSVPYSAATATTTTPHAASPHSYSSGPARRVQLRSATSLPQPDFTSAITDVAPASLPDVEAASAPAGLLHTPQQPQPHQQQHEAPREEQGVDPGHRFSSRLPQPSRQDMAATGGNAASARPSVLCWDRVSVSYTPTVTRGSSSSGGGVDPQALLSNTSGMFYSGRLAAVVSAQDSGLGSASCLLRVLAGLPAVHASRCTSSEKGLVMFDDVPVSARSYLRTRVVLLSSSLSSAPGRITRNCFHYRSAMSSGRGEEDEAYGDGGRAACIDSDADYAPLEELTVRENLVYAWSMLGSRKQHHYRRRRRGSMAAAMTMTAAAADRLSAKVAVEAVMEVLQLRDACVQNCVVRDCSLFTRRRVALGAALLNLADCPRVLLVDRVLDGLPAHEARQFVFILKLIASGALTRIRQHYQDEEQEQQQSSPPAQPMFLSSACDVVSSATPATGGGAQVVATTPAERSPRSFMGGPAPVSLSFSPHSDAAAAAISLTEAEEPSATVVVVLTLTQPRWSLLKYVDDIALLDGPDCVYGGSVPCLIPLVQLFSMHRRDSGSSSKASKDERKQGEEADSKEAMLATLYKLAAGSSGALVRAVAGHPRAQEAAAMQMRLYEKVRRHLQTCASGDAFSTVVAQDVVVSSNEDSAILSSAASTSWLSRQFCCCYGQTVVSGVRSGVGGFCGRLACLTRYSFIEVRNHAVSDVLRLVFLLVLVSLLLTVVYTGGDMGASGTGDEHQSGIQNRSGVVFLVMNLAFLHSIRASGSLLTRAHPRFLQHRARGYYSTFTYLLFVETRSCVCRCLVCALCACVVSLVMTLSSAVAPSLPTFYAEVGRGRGGGKGGLPSQVRQRNTPGDIIHDSSPSVFALALVAAVVSITTHALVRLLCMLAWPCGLSLISITNALFAVYTVSLALSGMVINLTTLPAPVQRLSMGSVLRLGYESGLLTQFLGRTFGCEDEDDAEGVNAGVTVAGNATSLLMLHDGDEHKRGIRQRRCYTGDEYAHFLGFNESREWANVWLLTAAYGVLVSACLVVMMCHRSP